MKLVLVASLCHAVSGIPAPVCHEEVVIDTYDGSPQMCALAQMGIAQWKANSKFSNEEWNIGRYKCVFGSYVKKDDL